MNRESVENNEAELIRQLRQGSRPAFDALVELYKNKGFGICYNLTGNVEDAKDVLQEVFIKVYLNIKNFEDKARFSTWFYRIAVNSSLDFLRKRKKMYNLFTSVPKNEEGEEKEFPDTRYDPARVLSDKESAGVLDKCIAELPYKQRVSFILKHQNGLKAHEIAGVLKCGVPTVKVHIFRAVRSLQGKLASHG
jgi:RNA polymerase sigma-70 factor (ECF subfamily)